MINWEEVLQAESDEKLKKAKMWLFQENMRLENEKRELEEMKEKFNKERVQFRYEMNVLNHRVVMERKKLKEESQFFDKKMDILKAGYEQLDSDRKKLDFDRKRFAEEKQKMKYGYFGSPLSSAAANDLARSLFKGVNTPMALRKRYKDLVKIYHPDNVTGDEEMIQIINKEFIRRKNEE